MISISGSTLLTPRASAIRAASLSDRLTAMPWMVWLYTKSGVRAGISRSLNKATAIFITASEDTTPSLEADFSTAVSLNRTIYFPGMTRVVNVTKSDS